MSGRRIRFTGLKKKRVNLYLYETLAPVPSSEHLMWFEQRKLRHPASKKTRPWDNQVKDLARKR